MAVPAKHKRILAGRMLLADPSRSQADVLVAAGYAKSTASKPAANGISAQHCIQAAVEADPSIASGALVESARSLLRDALRQMRDKPALLEKRINVVPRLCEVVERFHGSAAASDPVRDGREFADRLAWLESAARRYRELGGKRPGALDDTSGEPLNEDPPE